MLSWGISKTKHKIPIFDNKYLASSYDPIKEAQRWSDEVLDNLSKTSELIIVLGLGGAYHIIELKKKVTIPVLIIEMNQELIVSCPEELRSDIYYIDSVEGLWKSKIQSHISDKKTQVFTMFSAISNAINTYNLLLEEICLRNSDAINRHLDILESDFFPKGKRIKQQNHLLTVKDVNDDLTCLGGKKFWLWRAVGDLIK